jgi:hypothetical protein
LAAGKVRPCAVSPSLVICSFACPSPLPPIPVQPFQGLQWLCGVCSAAPACLSPRTVPVRSTGPAPTAPQQTNLAPPQEGRRGWHPIRNADIANESTGIVSEASQHAHRCLLGPPDRPGEGSPVVISFSADHEASKHPGDSRIGLQFVSVYPIPLRTLPRSPLVEWRMRLPDLCSWFAPPCCAISCYRAALRAASSGCTYSTTSHRVALCGAGRCWSFLPFGCLGYVQLGTSRGNRWRLQSGSDISGLKGA